MHRVFLSLRCRSYAYFWSGEFLSSLGHSIKEIALYWMAYEMTQSAMALGVLGLAEAAPRLILSVLGGVLADRYDRRKLLIVIQFLSAVPMFVLALLHFSGLLRFWHMLALVIIWAGIRSVNPSASQSLLRELIPDHQIINAVSLYTMGFSFARVAGLPLGGLLIPWIGGGGCFLLYGFSLVLYGLVLCLIRAPRSQVSRDHATLFQEISEGFRYIRGTPLILCSIGAAYIMSRIAESNSQKGCLFFRLNWRRLK